MTTTPKASGLRTTGDQQPSIADLPPRLRLKTVIKAHVIGLAAQRSLSERSGVDLNTLDRACKGRRIAADPYLALCAAIGIDPVTGAPCAPHAVGKVLWCFLGYGLMGHRLLRKVDQRAAAAQAGLTHPLICGVEKGRSVSTESLLKICAWMGVHPEAHTTPLCAGVSRGNTRFTKQNQRPEALEEWNRKMEARYP